ncbi:MAG: hypothetical protein DI629_10380 [Mesorhizobium amorphae]|nr:MAG: hypothetical protein DI629_10380 [Mesorhizobium amorphae]
MKRAAAILFLATALVPTTGAAGVLDQFADGRSACFARSYDAQHLARHPAQSVAWIALDRDRKSDDAGTTLRLRFRLKHSAEVFGTLVACRPSGSDARCLVEADGGALRLSEKGGALRLVAERVAVEGGNGIAEFHPKEDRVFLLRPQKGATCR